jgi:hypothetical protein
MKLLLDKNDINITEAMVTAAAANKKHGNYMMKVLLDRSDSIVLTAELVEVAIGNTDSGREVIELLLDRDIKITDDAIVTMAQRFDAKVMRLLLDRRRDVKFTKMALEAVADNKTSGKEIMELLLGRDIRATEGALATIARRFDAKVMALLLNRWRDIQITEVVMKAAAENKKSSKEMVKLLLRRCDIKDTEGTVAVIARRFDAEAMALLLDRWKDIQISESVLKAAAGNRVSGKEVMELLLSKGDS